MFCIDSDSFVQASRVFCTGVIEFVQARGVLYRYMEFHTGIFMLCSRAGSLYMIHELCTNAESVFLRIGQFCKFSGFCSGSGIFV